MSSSRIEQLIEQQTVLVKMLDEAFNVSDKTFKVRPLPLPTNPEDVDEPVNRKVNHSTIAHNATANLQAQRASIKEKQ